jgi:voltage-gated potassium channel
VCSSDLGIVANSFSAQLARKRAIFEAAIHRAIEDGVISSQEKDYLKRMRDEFNITKEHADAIFERALQERERRSN